MSAHTPGPWTYGTVTGTPGFQFFVDGDSSLVADVAARLEAEANARLIAAAPELADTLEMFLSGFSGDDVRLLAVSLFGLAVKDDIHQKCDHVNEALCRARAALRKAGRLP